MAALSLPRDERGAVYVEFLLAFLPIFLLFLAICQAAFLVAGRLVVNHAALVGARSAIVVLDDDPQHYDGAEREWLSDKPATQPKNDQNDALSVLSGVLSGGTTPSTSSPSSAPSAKKPPQQGARMKVIRGAALRPLTAIAPTAEALLGGAGATLEASLVGDSTTARAFARAYVEAAAVVTLHDDPRSEQLAAEPIQQNAPITVRVTFVQMCGIPVVRALMCRSLSTLLDAPARTHDDTGKHETLRERLSHAGLPTWLETSAAKSARFVVFESEMTLPNQGAPYAYAEKSDDQTQSNDQAPSDDQAPSL